MTQKELERYIFTNIFILNNKLEAAANAVLREISVKQWFLLIIIAQKEKESPSLTEIAEAFGSSRQNIAKMVEVLEKKGYVKTGKHAKDKRNITVVTTERVKEVFKEFDGRGSEFLDMIFKDITDVRLKIVYSIFEILFKNLEELSREKFVLEGEGPVLAREGPVSVPINNEPEWEPEIIKEDKSTTLGRRLDILID